MRNIFTKESWSAHSYLICTKSTHKGNTKHSRYWNCLDFPLDLTLPKRIETSFQVIPWKNSSSGLSSEFCDLQNSSSFYSENTYFHIAGNMENNPSTSTHSIIGENVGLGRIPEKQWFASWSPVLLSYSDWERCPQKTAADREQKLPEGVKLWWKGNRPWLSQRPGLTWVAKSLKISLNDI